VYHALLGPNTEVDGQNVLAGTADPSPAWLNMRSLPRLIAPESVLVRFTNNHDTNRVMSKIEGDMDRARAAAIWLLSVPGVPLIYYGEEIGMRGEKGTGPYYDEFRREPMDWYADEEGAGMTSWFMPPNGFNEPDDGVSVEEEDGVPGSLLEFYRAFGMLRREHAALHDSTLETYDIQRNTPLYVLRRWNDDEMFLVVINFTNVPQTLAGFGALAEIEGVASFDPGSMTEIISQGTGWPSTETDSLALEPAGFSVYRFTRRP
jgi:glycosidase